MTQDGLYLDNIWVAEVDAVLNYQANDLTKPETIQASYSNSFTLPDTLLLRDLTENGEQVDSGGAIPYRRLTAKLIEEGEVIFSGNAWLKSFKGGWKVNLFQAIRALFDVLSDKSLRDLDLSRFDHPWTLPGITALAGSTRGVVYPVVDYGAYDADAFASDAIFPAVYAHTLIQQMLLESGYRVAGDWLQEALIKRIAVPFVDDAPNNHDEDWVTDRSARVTVGPAGTDHDLEYSNSDIDFNPMPFIVDNQGDLFFDGKLNNFKPELHAYVCDTAMRLHVQATQMFKVKVGFGAIEASLQVMNNGKTAAQSYYSVGGPHNLTFTNIETLTLDEYIDCRAGDQITIRFTFNQRTKLTSSHQITYVDPEHSYAEFKPDPAIRNGDNWLVARNLPDLTCSELLKTIALMTSSTFDVNEFRHTVALVPLDQVVANTAGAVDWSNRVEESEEPEVSFTLEPYGAKNKVKWQNLDKVSPYGDGVISSPVENGPVTVDLFELPFAACLNSTKAVNGYGNPILIQTRTLSGTPPNQTVNNAATTPRLILIEPSLVVNTKANTLTPDNVLEVTPVTLTACWWADRPVGAKLATNGFSLAFDRVNPAQREQTLIIRYFNGLKRVLRRPRLLAVSASLYPADIATLDLSRSIRLQRVRAGGLQLNDGYYFLNKIENYSPGTTCTLQLVAF